jgi:hypothetical protein
MSNSLHQSESQRLLTSLLRLESLSVEYSCSDYLERERRLENQSDQLQRHWRERICEWCYAVIDQHPGDIPRDVVYVAMSVLDRFFARTSDHMSAGQMPTRRYYQLVSMTSLYIAVKVYYRKEGLSMDAASKVTFVSRENDVLSINALIAMGTEDFSIKNVEEMEKYMLDTLDWCICPLTPGLFVRSLMHSMDWTAIRSSAKEEIYQQSLFLCELASCDYFFVGHYASTVSLASIIVSCDQHLGPSGADLSYKSPGSVQKQTGAALRSLHSIVGLNAEKERIFMLCRRLAHLSTSVTDGDNDQHSKKVGLKNQSKARLVHVVSCEDFNKG